MERKLPVMLSIVSYNIHSGKDFLWRKRIDEMIATLLDLNVDIICIQEIHQNSRFGHQVDYFAKLLSMNSLFSPSIKIAEGGYGNAIFTNLPILPTSFHRLPSKKEGRSLLDCKIKLGDQEITVWVTHLSLDKFSRRNELLYMSEQLHTRQDESILVAGDFNTTSPILPAHLIDCAKAKGQEKKSTLLFPPFRLDYIFTTPDWHVLDYQVLDVRWSDHLPIKATLKQHCSLLPEQ